MKIAIIIGRFNPLHPGHLFLIQKVLSENGKLLIGIGSTQDINLPTYQDRAKKIKKGFKNSIKPYQIHSLVDQDSPDNWVKYLKNKLKLKDVDTNTLYRADPMDENHKKEFLKTGIKIKILPRFVFEYEANGKTYHLSSATEIRTKSNSKL